MKQVILLILILLVGCEKKTIIIDDQNKKNIEVIKEEKIEYTNIDMKTIETFNNMEQETDTENIDKLKGYFITIVDFIFYDGQINDVTFDELSLAGKEKVLKIASTIDEKIENKFPNYKENISDKTKNAFNKASELIKKGSNNIKDFSKEKLGEDNYNSLIEAKDDLIFYTKKTTSFTVSKVSSLWNKGKDKVKNWYENLKNN